MFLIMDGLVEYLSGTRYFSNIDLKSVYHKIINKEGLNGRCNSRKRKDFFSLAFYLISSTQELNLGLPSQPLTYLLVFSIPWKLLFLFLPAPPI